MIPGFHLTILAGHLLTKVSELIDPTTNQWDAQLVRQTFTPTDAKTIMSIPICEQYDDFIACHFDSKGMFSVRSAYRVYVQLRIQQRVQQVGEGLVGHQETVGFWQKLWKIRCPARVHHFLWRFAHNSHPMFCDVERLGIELDTRCVLCHRQSEDGGHLFL